MCAVRSVRRTTNISPRSFAVVHFKVYLSFLYVGFRAAEASLNVEPTPLGAAVSSMKTSLIRELMTLALTGAYDLDQRTIPDVVIISNESSMVAVRTGVDGGASVRREPRFVEAGGRSLKRSSGVL